MADKKSIEATQILRALTKDQLSALHKIRNDKEFADYVSVFNAIIQNEKDKIVGLQSDISTVDKAVEKASKGNFHRGRVSSLVLIHSLMKNAEYELERRENKNG